MRLAQQIALQYIRTKFKLLSSISKRKAAQAAFRLFTTPQARNRKKLPPVFEKAEKLHFSFEGDTVRGYRWSNPAGDGKKALILHGFESSVINFDRYVKPLIKKGYEVLAFDAPAHGRSSGKRINVLIYKKMIIHINKVYGPVNSFIAHSLGGLSLCLALEEMEHDEQCRIALIAPATETVRAIDNFFGFLRLDQGVRREFDSLINTLGGHPPDWYSVTRAAKNIRAQVLFLQDKDDNMTPFSDVLPLMGKNHPNFRFVISEGLGHRRIYRDNKVYRAILDFL
ncbi:MAG TPA: alpha/beta fold hydrolase [Flavisolibacter sp.]|nr:alpha/beta fold hydrolase [Flavisolibacter sp.]